MTGVAYENGELVPIQDGLDENEIAMAENYGIDGKAAAVAGGESELAEDLRISAVRLSLQFVHDADNCNLALHIVGFLSGCFFLKSQSEIAARINVSFGIWARQRDEFAQMMDRMVGPDWKAGRIIKAIAGVVSEIGGAAQPRLAVLQLASACGIDLNDGESGTVVAKSFGTSKQGFHQGKKRYMRRLRLTKTRACRRESKKFSTNNFRHAKKSL